MDAQWYYARNGTDRLGPVSESEIHALVAQGQIRPDDLLWREGMPAWAALKTLSVFQAPVVPDASVVAKVAIPGGLGGWMAFTGVINILVGLLSVFTCFALPTGILQIIGGAALLSGSSILARMPGIDPEWLPFFQKTKTFFLMTGIGTLVAVAMTLLVLVLGLGLGAASVASMAEQFTTP